MFHEVEFNACNIRGKRIVILLCERKLILVATFAMKQIKATETWITTNRIIWV
jgi:hypothetical protein